MDENASSSASSQDQISFFFSSPQNGTQMPFSDDSGARSEEFFEVAEGLAAKSAPHRSSGSKRSRAAEVHNLSEKRRRSRINEKMKALQNLIPNSNKTDKASMLDEAIEYLKQLQLQVQMLSMRNGLNVHPMYLPGALQPLQASQICMGFGVDNASAMNMGAAGMLPLNQDSSACNSLDLSSQCTSSHPPILLPSTVANITTQEASFGMESSQSHHGSFQLPVANGDMFAEGMVPQQHMDAGRTARSQTENDAETMDVAAVHFRGQAPLSALDHNDHLEDVLPKDCTDSHQTFVQHLDGLQKRSFTSDDAKTESP